MNTSKSWLLWFPLSIFGGEGQCITKEREQNSEKRGERARGMHAQSHQTERSCRLDPWVSLDCAVPLLPTPVPWVFRFACSRMSRARDRWSASQKGSSQPHLHSVGRGRSSSPRPCTRQRGLRGGRSRVGSCSSRTCRW